MLSLALLLTTSLVLSLQTLTDIDLNWKQYTMYYESYHYSFDFLNDNKSEYHHEYVISLNKLHIYMDTLLNITINNHIHLNYFYENDWNQVKHNTIISSMSKRRLQESEETDPRYSMSPVTMTWDEGRSYCLQNYGSMATIMSSDDNEEADTACSGRCWIGLKEEEGQPMIYKEWAGGRRIAYLHWSHGNPSNDNGEGADCVEILSGGKWNDIPCDWDREVLCEHGSGHLNGNYIAVPAPKTYTEADEYCMTHYGTHLATIHSFMDNKQVQTACDEIGIPESDNEVCWIGLRSPFKTWEDGIYTTGWGKFQNWYDEQEGHDQTRWRLILRLKDVANGYFNSQLKVDGLEHSSDPESNTYSIIGELNPSDYLDIIDDKYQFKLIYKNVNDEEVELIWKQKSWLDRPETEAFEPINVPGDITGCGQFQGLAISENRCSYLDGNGHSACWWNSVGTICQHNGGIPAFKGQIAKSQALYIYSPEEKHGICGVVHSDSKWYDEFCADREHFVCNAMSFSERMLPMTRHRLEQMAYVKHYHEWMEFKQLEHMKDLMEKTKEHMDAPYDPKQLQSESERADQLQMDQEKWEELRNELTEKGVFEPYKQQGMFTPRYLRSHFGNGQYGYHLRYSFPVPPWIKTSMHRRLLEMERRVEDVMNFKCVLIWIDGGLYDVCIGFHGIDIRKYLFYKEKKGFDDQWSDDLMDIDKWRYEQIVNMKDTNESVVYRLDGDYVYNEIEYKMENAIMDKGQQCLTKYICFEIMDDNIILFEMIMIEGVSTLRVDFNNDNEWDEIVIKHSKDKITKKCIHLYHSKICIESTHDPLNDVDLYRASITM